MLVARSIVIGVFFGTRMAWSHVGAICLMVSSKTYRSVEPDKDLRWPPAVVNRLIRLTSHTAQDTQAGGAPAMPRLASIWVD